MNNPFQVRLVYSGGGCFSSTAGNLRRTKNWLQWWQSGLPTLSERLGGLRENDVAFLIDEKIYLELALAMEG